MNNKAVNNEPKNQEAVKQGSVKQGLVKQEPENRDFLNKYFVFDRGILQPQGMENAALHICPLKKDEEHNPLFTEGFFGEPPKRWEVRYDNAYPNMIFDAQAKRGKYRVYYTLCSYDPESAVYTREQRAKRTYTPRPGRVTSLACAMSEDGVHWEKPELGLVEFEGNKNNNMVFRYAHGTGIFLDEEETDQKKRYKLVTKVEYPGGFDHMAVNFSEDGLHWGKMIPWPTYNPAADSHNFPFRDKKDGKFKVITRTWKNGVRLSAICESADFINWSEPKEILRGDGFESQVYSMPVFQYEGLYLGLASMYHEGDRGASDFDTVDCELKYATAPETFDSVLKGEALIPRGKGMYPNGDFDCGCVYAASPIEEDGRLLVYYMGGNGRHTDFRETSFGRGWLEKDKFAYFQQKNQADLAVIATAQFHIYGERVRILADMEEAGSLEAAFYDCWNGKAYEGYDFGDCHMELCEDGYYELRFAKPMLGLGIHNVCILLRFRGVKVYALEGELVSVANRY